MTVPTSGPHHDRDQAGRCIHSGDHRGLPHGIAADRGVSRDGADGEYPSLWVDALEQSGFDKADRLRARGAAARPARRRDPPGKIKQVGAAQILEREVQARLGLKQTCEAEAHRHHQQAEAERDAQHVRDDRAEAEVRGRGGDHDDVRSRRQRHDGGEQEQRPEHDALVHAAHHWRNGGDELGGKSWRESPRSLR